MNSLMKLLVVVFILLLARPALAAGPGKSGSSPPSGTDGIGQVHFPVSCSSQAQEKFQRALAILHSFWYEEAERLFSEAAETDPDCAMAYWGIAMSRYHPLWEQPSPEDLRRGREAVEKARAAGKPSNREKAYITALESFYGDSDRLDHRARAVRYENAMKALADRFPEDLEAAVFYALALNSTVLAADKTYANQEKAARILEKAFADHPNHPGIAHYLIHTYDYPPLAERGLPAARRYASIAPAVPHARHMPSHIFTRLGLWRESIASNRATVEAAREHLSRTQPGASAFEELHAMDYLAYASLQIARDRDAADVAETAARARTFDMENFAVAYAVTAIPARFALERRRWEEAAALTPHPAPFLRNFPFAEANVHFARAIGAARSGDPASAREGVERLEILRDSLLRGGQAYWADQVEVHRLGAAAWLARAEGNDDAALGLMREAADLEDRTEKHPVTPGNLLPARELLGDLLLELGRPEAALPEFEASLSRWPGRFNAVYLAGLAAECAGDRGKARRYYDTLVTMCEGAGKDRPELEKARAFLASPLP
jgi:tetratricopeptide (TPR) repeat protein